MKKDVFLLSILSDNNHLLGDNNIGNDFIVIDDFSKLPLLKFPFKLDMTAIMICTKGSGRGTIDMQSYNLTAPFVIFIRPNQIMNYEYISPDLTGYCIMISNRISTNFLLNIDNSLPIVSALREKPFTQLNDEDLKYVRRYFMTLKQLMPMKENMYRLEMVKHLSLFYFHLIRPRFHIFAEATKQTKQGELLDQFTQLLRDNYRREHDTAFYADKLNLTSKYLSQLIKSSTGKSVADWIEEFVILEAKALLKSTNMNIQEISDELNFPSQSAFGKYFKRITGFSPSDYKKVGANFE